MTTSITIDTASHAVEVETHDGENTRKFTVAPLQKHVMYVYGNFRIVSIMELAEAPAVPEGAAVDG